MNPRPLAAALVLVVPFAATRAQDARAKRQICLVTPTVQASPGRTADAAAAVSETFATFLTGPGIAARPLTARLASQARQEASTSGCHYVLLTTLKHVRKTRGGGLLGKATYGAVHYGTSVIDGLGRSVGARVATSAAAGAAREAAFHYAYATRPDDEMTLTWRLESASGERLQEQTDRRTAGADGEDLLTPLVQRASEAVAAIVARPTP